jgi:cytidylate kinase
LEKNLGGIYAGKSYHDQLYFSQAKIIKELAEKGPCVIVGRCADYILRDRKDKLRADHYRYYTDQKWGDSFHYHLCLDSSMFGIEKCVDIIEDACKAMCPPS